MTTDKTKRFNDHCASLKLKVFFLKDPSFDFLQQLNDHPRKCDVITPTDTDVTPDSIPFTNMIILGISENNLPKRKEILGLLKDMNDPSKIPHGAIEDLTREFPEILVIIKTNDFILISCCGLFVS